MITHNKINYTLLGTLWILAIVLVLDFWLNTAYNFNMFSTAHWQYVANLQAAHKPIKSGFYIAITLAISFGIFGLFMLFRPRFRKILLGTPSNTSPDKTIPQTQTVERAAYKKNTEPVMQRPPQLHIQTTQKPLRAPAPYDTPAATKPEKPVAKYTTETSDIFTQANYKVLTPKTIKGVPLSLVAIGSNETLWFGACEISHEQIADIILAFKSVFDETLNDINIDINAFIINPTDNDNVDGVLDVKSIDELKKFISQTKNEPEFDDETESDNMDAFSGYIETVLAYLGNV